MVPVSITPSRLRLARLRRGFSMRHLADKVGLSSRAITAYEAGTMGPTAETLAAVADELKFPIEFFSRPPIEPPSAYGASFRSLEKMLASERDKAISAGVIATEISAWTDEKFDLPVPWIPDLRDATPEQAAEEVRNLWGLGLRPVGNLVHLFEAKGIRVFSLAENTRNVDAFSFWYDEKPFVFLNTMKSAEHSRFDGGHELGHLTMHRHGPPRGRDPERDAQAFASAFLMPRADVLAHAPRMPSLENLIRVKRRWGVSLAALVYRIRTLGLVSDWQYRTLYQRLSARGYRTTEPEPLQREVSQVYTKVFRTLRSEEIGDTILARDLSLNPADVHGLVFGLALSPLTGGGAPRTRPTDTERSAATLRQVK